MVKVAFLGTVSKEWMGGLNYYKNLLFALSCLENSELDIYVFVGKNSDESIKLLFKEYATIIEDSIADKKSFKWYISKIEQRFFKTNFILEGLLKKYKIDVLSHSGNINLNSIKTVNWIPDFQHMHLKEMFSQKELKKIDNRFKNLIKYSDTIILSSNDAYRDYKKFTAKYHEKAKVLQFVSQPDERYYSFDDTYKNELKKKYDLSNQFFYIPNQFWKHKNHITVFKAIKELKDEDIDICVVCSGYLKDYRNQEHLSTLTNFIKDNQLEKNIRLLGLIDYKDVFAFIKFSKAVINPSLFEGWSSTVEECKSVGKNMILSDIDVHKEQYIEADFFEKESVESLKNVLKRYNAEENLSSKKLLKERTENFASKYEKFVLEVVEKI
jgi:glycosyltransferase involved in cell wall biosynthesis